MLLGNVKVSRVLVGPWGGFTTKTTKNTKGGVFVSGGWWGHSIMEFEVQI